jgi:hypothetical protein
MHFSIPSTKEEFNNAFKEAKAEYTRLSNNHLNVYLAELDKAVEAHTLTKNKDKPHI